MHGGDPKPFYWAEGVVAQNNPELERFHFFFFQKEGRVKRRSWLEEQSA